MAITVPRGKQDEIIDQMIKVLEAHQADHPKARIELYRYNRFSARIRIIDADFADQTRAERSKAVWKYLGALDDEAQADISSLILLAPDETGISLMNLEFDDPTPSTFP